MEPSKIGKKDYISVIVDYIKSTKGLSLQKVDDVCLEIVQKQDLKVLTLKTETIKEVIFRYNKDYNNFLQVNFKNEGKILITDKLIGFPPKKIIDLEGIKLPKVISTLDMLSFFEMTEEYIQSDNCSVIQVVALKKVCDLILESALDVGFNVVADKTWFHQISYSLNKPNL